MTPDENEKKLVVVDNVPTPFEEKAKALLSIPEYNMLMDYVKAGRHPLAPDTVGSLYQLYLNGSDCREIHRLNKAFPYESILWARIKYDWDAQKDDYVIELQNKIREKVIKSQLETTELMADLLTATSKMHSDKIKKYIQTGNEADLGNSMTIDSLAQLLRIAEGLQKITGQDRTQKIETKNTQRIEVGLSTSSRDGSQSVPISEEGAAALLAILAQEKSKSSGKKESN